MITHHQRSTSTMRCILGLKTCTKTFHMMSTSKCLRENPSKWFVKELSLSGKIRFSQLLKISEARRQSYLLLMNTYWEAWFSILLALAMIRFLDSGCQMLLHLYSNSIVIKISKWSGTTTSMTSRPPSTMSCLTTNMIRSRSLFESWVSNSLTILYANMSKFFER